MKKKQNQRIQGILFCFALCLWAAWIPAASAADVPPDTVIRDGPADTAASAQGISEAGADSAQEISEAGAASAQEVSENTADTAQRPFGAYGTTAGTAILIGAGAYTFVRTKKKEKKPEQEYVYFENHTRRERENDGR